MGSYAAAKAAVRTRLDANWTTTRIAYQNEVPASPWPPTTGSAGSMTFAPWVFLEISNLPARIHGAGKPGSIVTVTPGFILVHVFVPRGSGDATATQYAETIGEIFRNAKFYDAGDGCYARSWTPRVDEGGPAMSSGDIEMANSGNYFRVTMSVPFEYWHRG